MTSSTQGDRGWQSYALCAGMVTFALAMPAATSAAEGCAPTTIGFAGLKNGALLAEQYADQGIHASAVANNGRPNQLVIFDSHLTGTSNHGLEVGIGNVAFIPEEVVDKNGDGIVDKVRQSHLGGTQIYRFDTARRVESVVAVDIDHGTAADNVVTVFGAGDVIIKQVPLKIGADKNVQTVQLAVDGVTRLEIAYRDSGGVTNLALGCSAAPSPSPSASPSPSPSPSASPSPSPSPSASPSPSPSPSTSASPSPSPSVAPPAGGGGGGVVLPPPVVQPPTGGGGGPVQLPATGVPTAELAQYGGVLLVAGMVLLLRGQRGRHIRR